MKRRNILLAISACLALHLYAADNYAQLFYEARQARYAKEYDKALKLYEKAGKTAKNIRGKYNAMSESVDMLIEMKDFAGAERKLKKILSSSLMKNPQKASALLRLGNIKRDQGNDKGAEADYQKALRHHPGPETHRHILISCAALYIKREDYDTALDFLRKAQSIPVRPEYDRGAIALAKLYLARIAVIQKRYDDALRYYTEIPRISKVSRWTASNAYQEKITKILLPQKRFKEAQKCLDEAEGSMTFPHWMKKWIPDTRALAYLQEAGSNVSLKKYNEAEKLLKSARGIPNISQKLLKDCEKTEKMILLARGKDLKSRKRYNEAEKIFRKLLSMKDQEYMYSANLELGYLYLNQRKFSNAKKYFADAEKLSSADPDKKVRSMISFADYHRNMRRYDDALKSLAKPYPEEKTSPSIRAQLYGKFASVYFSKKEMGKAEGYCRKALDIAEAPAFVKKDMEALLKKITKDQ